MRTRLLRSCCLSLALPLMAADPPAPSYSIQTVAGSDFAVDGASALAAIFSQAEGITVDSSGAVYVADADGNRIRKINLDGSIQTVAGTGMAGFAGDGGPSQAALLNHPYGVALDVQGNLYIADLGNGRVRKISNDGTIRTIAGGGTIAPGGNGDGGPAASAQLLEPRNVAVDPDGTLYISDFGAHRVFRVTPGGILTTLAGTGSAGFSGDGSSPQLAQLNSPAGLASDANGAVYFADSANNRIRKVYQGVISTIYSVTGPTGVAISPTAVLYIAARGYLGTQFKAVGGLPSARDVAIDRTGNVYATAGQYVNKITSNGTVTTVAGSGALPYFGGDNGPATAARLHAPSGLTVDDAGNWYIADTANNRVRKITPTGVITTIAGTGDAGSKGDNGPATLAQLNGPRSVAVDSQHNIYIADSGNNSIRKITPGGIIQTAAIQLAAALNDPEYVATDSQDSLYIADAGNGRVLKVSSSGLVSTVMLVAQPSAVTVDGSGNVYVSEPKRVSRVTPGGAITTVLDGLNSPRGVAITATGDVLVADSGASVVRKLSSSGLLSTIAGVAAPGFSGDGLSASSAHLNTPSDLMVDLTGAIWIADSGNNRIRTLTPSSIADVAAPAILVHSASLAPGPRRAWRNRHDFRHGL
jgi:sugar lactone lactonase YvrE